MSVESIDDIITPHFQALTAKNDRGNLLVTMTGLADTRVFDEVKTFISTLDVVAQRQFKREVIVDMRNLNFLNSSCFKAFVGWVNKLNDRQGGEVYHVRFLTDPKKSWQKRSLLTLSCFAGTLIAIE